MVRCDFCDGDEFKTNKTTGKREPLFQDEDDFGFMFTPCSCEEFNKGQIPVENLDGDGFTLDDRNDDPWEDVDVLDPWDMVLDPEEDSEE